MAKKVVGDEGRASEGLINLHGGTIEVGKDLDDALTLEDFDKDVLALVGLVGQEATKTRGCGNGRCGGGSGGVGDDGDKEGSLQGASDDRDKEGFGNG